MNNLAKQNAAFPLTDEEMETAKRTDLPDLLEHLGYTVHRSNISACETDISTCCFLIA